MNQELGSMLASVTACRGASGTLHVTGLGGEDGKPYLTYQDSTGIWHDTGRIKKDDDTPWSALATGKGSSNFLQVIGLGRENGLPYSIWQDDKGDWHDAGRLAVDNNTPWSVLATGYGHSNFLQVIGLGGEDGLPYLIWQDGKGDWHDAGRLVKGNDTPWSALSLSKGSSNSLQVIGLGRDDGLPYLVWQDSRGGWHDAGRLSKDNNTPWSALVTGTGSPNFLQVIGLGRDDGLPYLMYQDNKGVWHDSGRLMKDNNTPWSALAAYRGDGNKLYVVGLGRKDGLLYLMYQDGLGFWHDGGLALKEYDIPWSSLVVETGNANFLHVIGLGREDGLAYLIYQDDQGIWHNYGLLPVGGLKVERPLKPGEVLVFSEENHEGREWLVTTDAPSLDRYFNVASFRIGPKTGVTLYSSRKYQGLTQNLTAELGSFTGSKLQEKKPKSLRIWMAAGRAFTGYWAIEAADGRYLSVHPDAKGKVVLTTSLTVTDSEAFRIVDQGQAGPGRRKAAFRVRRTPDGEPLTLLKAQALSIDDLQKLILVDEQEAGFRKFSLLVGNQWIYYNPEEDRFWICADAKDRTIFCQSIKIAEDETQVGELFLGEVALFENPCYWGKAWVFHKDYADFNRVVNLNDEVSSIQLGPLTGATIYREAQFTADDPKAGKQDVISDIPYLEKEQVDEDQISSIDLWRIIPPERFDVTFTCSLSQDFRGAGGTFEEYSAYRTTLRLPPTVDTVDVWTTDATEIEVDDQTYKVDEDNPVTLRPNLFHSLVITTDAMVSPSDQARKGSLKAPGLKIRTNTMLPHERIVIFPDQHVHARLSDLKDGELWNATIKDPDGNPQPLIKDRNPQKQNDAANAQNMIKKIMSTVKYSKKAYGGHEQSIAPEELHGQYWALDFFTYRVNAATLYVREGPGTNFKPVGFLRKNDIVEAIEFNLDASWVHLRRLSDGLSGWSSRIYMDKITDRPLTGDRYRVIASKLPIREGPGRGFRLLGTIQINDIVTAIGVNDTGTWRQICRSDGLVGWCFARSMALVLPLPAPDDIIGNSFRVSGKLNVREGPGANFKTVGFLQRDEIVEALEANADGSWLRVRRTRDGLIGWVWSRYLIRIAPTRPPSQQPSMVPVTAEEAALPSGVPAAIPTPSPDVIALSPDMRFREASREDVQALLALAESPDTELAQGWFGDIVHAVKTAVSFVIAEVQQGVAIIVQFAEKVVKWVVDTAEKAVAFVEGIFEKIGMVIADVIKWLRFIFNWDDILDTRDYLRETINNALDYIGHTLVQKAEAPIKNFFNTQKGSIIKRLDEVIISLGGTIKNEAPPKATSGNVFEGISDTIDWILSKVLRPGQGGSAFAFEAIDAGGSYDRVEQFWYGTFAKGFENMAALPGGIAEVVVTLLKKPDEPLLAVAELIRVFRDLLVGLLDTGEGIALGLLRLASTLVEEIKKIITADIRIPFISDLLEWMGKQAVTLGFSLLDAAALILAIPITVVYKAIFNEAPCKNIPSLALEIDTRTKLLLKISSGISSMFNAMVCAALDATPESDENGKVKGKVKGTTGWEVFSWLLAVVSYFGDMCDFEFPDSTDSDQQDNFSKVVKTVLAIVDYIYIVADELALFIGQERLKRWTKPAIYAASLIGFVRILGLFLAGFQSYGYNLLDTLLDIGAVLPEPLSLLRLSKSPNALMALVLVDLWAGLAAGGAMIKYIAENPLPRPTAQPRLASTSS